jgi:2,3-bisphosphoglycerate-dependent phosphoglycerate mutase
MTQPVRLVLLRHGQSEWNAAGIFAGWENAHLTAHGEAEAARAGSMLIEHGVLPAFVYTSLPYRTATRCGRWSSTWSRYRTTRSPGWRSPPASRCCTSSGRT